MSVKGQDSGMVQTSVEVRNVYVKRGTSEKEDKDTTHLRVSSQF